jgi:hypothetical protein
MCHEEAVTLKVNLFRIKQGQKNGDASIPAPRYGLQKTALYGPQAQSLISSGQMKCEKQSDVL